MHFNYTKRSNQSIILAEEWTREKALEWFKKEVKQSKEV